MNKATVFNEKYYGLLNLCIIPFVSYQNDICLSEIISKISNENIKQKCEDFYND